MLTNSNSPSSSIAIDFQSLQPSLYSIADNMRIELTGVGSGVGGEGGGSGVGSDVGACHTAC